MRTVEINKNDLLDIICKHTEFLKSGTSQWYVTYTLENEELEWRHNSSMHGKLIKVFSPLVCSGIRYVKSREEWREYLSNPEYISLCANELYEFKLV